MDWSSCCYGMTAFSSKYLCLVLLIIVYVKLFDISNWQVQKTGRSLFFFLIHSMAAVYHLKTKGGERKEISVFKDILKLHFFVPCTYELFKK